MTAVNATATYASVQFERHTAASQLQEVRRKWQGASLIAKRCLDNEAQLRRGVQVLKDQSSELKEDRESRTRLPRMQLEEAAEAALKKAEGKIAGIISAAQQGGLDL